ncbi:hypothetical protein CMK18_22330 [Candidatus Poribacteria bacterium]|nr:hypothetical protein [Candidatus Poribacteria bacterium]
MLKKKRFNLKVTFEVVLPQQQKDFSLIVKAPNMSKAICEYDMYLRDRYKYEGCDIADDYRVMLHEFLIQNDVELWD